VKTKILWFLLMVFFIAANVGLAQAPIDTILLVPANPTPTDSVTIKAVFVFPDYCHFATKGMLWQYPEVWYDTLCSDTTCKYYLLQTVHLYMGYTLCPSAVKWDTVSFSLGQLNLGEYWIDLMVVSYDLFWPPRVTTYDTIFTFSITPTKVNEEQISAPDEFELSQNYPNPFNPSTTIDYTVEKEGFADLLIYNILGQKVRTLVGEMKEAGAYSVRWDGRNEEGEKLPNGVYFYVLKTGDYTSSKKMILLK